MRDMPTQYRIITAGAGWVDRRAAARLRFDGADRATFLQGLLTSDVLALGVGRGAYAAYLTPQGRMITDLRLYHRGEWLMVEVGAGRAAEFAERFDGLVFSEDVRVTDVSARYGQLSVIGAGAPDRLARALGCDASQLATMAAFDQLDIDDGFVARTDDTGWPSFDVFTAEAASPSVLSRLEAAGVEPIPDELIDALRIESGRPVFGRDMTEETIPLEAGLLDRAISMTKGCYVGQEVVVRILDRGGGKVARRLVKLQFRADARVQPQAGSVLSVEGLEVGHLTSVALSPTDGHFVGLGYLKRDVAEVGTEVAADVAGTSASAHVTALV